MGEFSKLPGIGRKTALRLVLHMLRRPVAEAEAFAEAVPNLQQILGEKPTLYLSLGDVRLAALEGVGGAYRFAVISGTSLPTGVENTVFSEN